MASDIEDDVLFYKEVQRRNPKAVGQFFGRSKIKEIREFLREVGELPSFHQLNGEAQARRKSLHSEGPAAKRSKVESKGVEGEAVALGEDSGVEAVTKRAVPGADSSHSAEIPIGKVSKGVKPIAMASLYKGCGTGEHANTNSGESQEEGHGAAQTKEEGSEKQFLKDSGNPKFRTKETVKEETVTSEGDEGQDDRNHENCPVAGCGKAFPSMNDLEEHMQTHKEPFICAICRFSAQRRSLLLQHNNTHTGSRPFECDTCDKKFSWKSALAVHRRSHTGNKPYTCNFCEKKFVQSCDLQNHLRTHSGERPYSCGFCPFTSTQLSNVKGHERRHKGEKPFPCSFCSMRFSQSSGLANHTKNRHH